MRRTSLAFGLLVLAACGTKKASPDGGGGSTGADAASTAGSGGATAGAGALGVAGTSGNGGAAGASATGVAGQGAAGTGGEGQGAAGTGGAGQGAAGSAGGGASGDAGAAGGATGAVGGAECETAQDCVLVSDCCACRAEPKGRPVDSCAATCTVDVCRANEIQQHEVTCVHNRCMVARRCDTAKGVTCLADPPACPPGTIPSVLDSCWGPCLLPTECTHVNDCGVCGDGSVCVRNNDFSRVGIACVTPAPDCRAGNYCGCLAVCPVACGETDAGVSCFCGGC